MKVLVLGSNGFIGRNIVAKLQLQGAQVVIGNRNFYTKQTATSKNAEYVVSGRLAFTH